MTRNIHTFSLPAIIFCSTILISFGAAGQQTTKPTTAAENSKQQLATIKLQGQQLFKTTCSACHGNPAFPKAPSVEALSAIQPQVILNALDNGKMRQQAKGLTEKQREAVAQFITNKLLAKIPEPGKDAYTAFSLSGDGDTAHDYSGWGGNLEATGFRTIAQSGITTENVGTLQLKWAFAFPGASEVRSKPAVVGDWIIVGSQFGEVYAINKNTGKIGWQVKATGAIRSGIVVVKKGSALTAYFADASTYVFAVNVRTGKVLWSARAGVDSLAMNTGTVAVYAGKVLVPISSVEVAQAYDGNYNCCTTSGGLAALDAKTGTAVWYHRVIAETASPRGKKKNGKPFYGPSGAPVWCSPTVDVKRGLVYIGSGENYTEPTTNTSDAIQAIDIKTGKLVWNFQATQHDAWNIACPGLVNCPGSNGRDFDFGMAPVLVHCKDGTDRLMAGQKAGVVYALSPDDGKLLWKTRIGKGGMLGGIHWGMATDGNNIYAANADNSLALSPDDTTIKASPGIYALDAITGNVVWSAPTPATSGKESYLTANSAPPAITPGLVFAGSLDGHIRAYDIRNGNIVWDYNSIQKYKTTDGLDGMGGSIDCSAPVMAGGMLIINSGYAQFGEKPGNVLLAFEVKK